jgi:hypothetical protein
MSAAPTAPATAPTAWWDDAGRPDGVLQGEWMGHVGSGGLALVAVVILILATRKGGKNGLKSTPALIVAFLVGSILMGAGGVWASPADLIRQAMVQLGVGTGAGPLGDIGMGAVALLATGICVFVGLKPKMSAAMGIILAVVYAAAGGAWGMIATLAAHLTGGLA